RGDGRGVVPPPPDAGSEAAGARAAPRLPPGGEPGRVLGRRRGAGPEPSPVPRRPRRRGGGGREDEGLDGPAPYHVRRRGRAVGGRGADEEEPRDAPHRVPPGGRRGGRPGVRPGRDGVVPRRGEGEISAVGGGGDRAPPVRRTCRRGGRRRDDEARHAPLGRVPAGLVGLALRARRRVRHPVRPEGRRAVPLVLLGWGASYSDPPLPDPSSWDPSSPHSISMRGRADYRDGQTEYEVALSIRCRGRRGDSVHVLGGVGPAGRLRERRRHRVAAVRGRPSPGAGSRGGRGGRGGPGVERWGPRGPHPRRGEDGDGECAGRAGLHVHGLKGGRYAVLADNAARFDAGGDQLVVRVSVVSGRGARPVRPRRRRRRVRRPGGDAGPDAAVRPAPPGVAGGGTGHGVPRYERSGGRHSRCGAERGEGLVRLCRRREVAVVGPNRVRRGRGVGVPRVRVGEQAAPAGFPRRERRGGGG
ncbi:hypothetical protein THAOC_26596, partial [Thalassiosira oceanica]